MRAGGTETPFAWHHQGTGTAEPVFPSHGRFWRPVHVPIPCPRQAGR